MDFSICFGPLGEVFFSFHFWDEGGPLFCHDELHWMCSKRGWLAMVVGRGDAFAGWCTVKWRGWFYRDIFRRFSSWEGEGRRIDFFLLGLPGKITTILSYSPIFEDSISFSVARRAWFVGSLCPSIVFKLAWLDLIVYEYYSVLAPDHILLFSCCKWSDSCLGSSWWLTVIYYFMFVLLVFNL